MTTHKQFLDALREVCQQNAQNIQAHQGSPSRFANLILAAMTKRFPPEWAAPEGQTQSCPFCEQRAREEEAKMEREESDRVVAEMEADADRFERDHPELGWRGDATPWNFIRNCVLKGRGGDAKGYRYHEKLLDGKPGWKRVEDGR